jgi:hypothetical protein
MYKEINAGTLSIVVPPRVLYIPLFLAGISREVRIGSEDLAATFVGVLKAYRSENLLESAKYIQKVRGGSD